MNPENTRRDSSSISPTILSGQTSFTSYYSPSGGLLTEQQISSSIDVTNPFDVFVSFDNDDFLFKLPLDNFGSTLAGLAPIWAARTKLISTQAAYYLTSYSPLSIPANTLVVDANNFSQTADHTVNVQYIIYGSRAE